MRQVSGLRFQVAAPAVLAALVATSVSALKMDELKEPDEGQLAKIKAALPEKCEPPAKARKLFVFYLAEGFVHSSILHGNACLRELGAKTGAFVPTFSKDKADFTAANLASYDAVLFNNTTHLKLDDAQRKAIVDFVNGGKGIAGFHAASDNFQCCQELSDMIGGQFDGHPWGAGGWNTKGVPADQLPPGVAPGQPGPWAFKLDDPQHPVNRAFGGKGFYLVDEIYQIRGAYSHENSRELISLDMSNPVNLKVNTNGFHRKDGDFPVAWLKKIGGGRVFYCSLGHREDVYQNKAVVQHYLDGIQYALGDLKADDRPTAEARKK